ncbi:unnamed protein product [Nesidiocoris tenuis]|uniref:Uncharacterized protein n=1 Tax=Nesidiocoris tenuis TaxID=355587 RepID=A0A6H5HU40_9HEMI|nr:unnamed protein product [Nesidiocoris tenuis]
MERFRVIGNCWRWSRPDETRFRTCSLPNSSDDSNRVTGSRCGSTGGPASTELKCSRAPRRWWTSPAARCAWAAVGIPDRRNSSVRGIDAKTLTFIPSISKRESTRFFYTFFFSLKSPFIRIYVERTRNRQRFTTLPSYSYAQKDWRHWWIEFQTAIWWRREAVIDSGENFTRAFRRSTIYCLFLDECTRNVSSITVFDPPETKSWSELHHNQPGARTQLSN